MKTTIIFRLVFAIALTVFSTTVAFGQITWGNVDDFTIANAAGWSEGGSSPNPPVHNTGNGLDGLAGHLENVSDGGGPGGRWLMFNSDSRWTGDYVNAGVTQLLVDFDNRSGNGTAANFRVALNGSGGWFLSDDFLIADGSGWQQVGFDLLALNHLNGGSAVLNDTLTGVTQIEFLSSVSDVPTIGGGGQVRGDNLVADFRIDNITAVPEPGSMTLIACGVLGLMIRRRK